QVSTDQILDFTIRGTVVDDARRSSGDGRSGHRIPSCELAPRSRDNVLTRGTLDYLRCSYSHLWLLLGCHSPEVLRIHDPSARRQHTRPRSATNPCYAR